jgi:hypothetical protein
MAGRDFESLILEIAMQDIDFKDPKVINGMKDSFKVQFFNQQLHSLSLKPQFLKYIPNV